MTLYAYQWSAVTNWGDLLSVPLLRRFAGLRAVAVNTPNVAHVAAVGSVLGHFRPFWGGSVLGAGILSATDTVPRCDPFLLRGHLTAATMHAMHDRFNIPVGDPGLLADELVETQPRIQRLGILPHWSDDVLATRQEFLRYDPVIIDPRREPEAVIKDIASCHKLVTSSLHGTIVADSLGIPRRVEQHPRLGKEGGWFKFHDYSSAIGHEFVPGVTSAPQINNVNDARDRIKDAFEAFGQYVRSGRIEGVTA